MQIIMSQSVKNSVKVLAGCALLIFLLWLFQPKLEPNVVTTKVWRIHAIQCSPTHLQPNLTQNGIVESLHHATLRAGIRENVRQVLVREGDAVVQQQLLVTLEDRAAQAALNQAEAELTIQKAQYDSRLAQNAMERKRLTIERSLLMLAKKQVERQQSLRDKNLTSPAALDERLQKAKQQELAVRDIELKVQLHQHQLQIAAAALKKARAARDNARVDLARTQIRAPFAGKVTEVMVAIGDHLTVGAPVLRLYDQKQLEIRSQVPSDQAHAIQVALNQQQVMTAQLIQPSLPDVKLKLVRLNSSIQGNEGGHNIFLTVKQKTLQLTPGQTVQFLLILPTVHQVLAIPRSALYDDNHIFVVAHNKLQRVPVRIVGRTTQADGQIVYLARTTETLFPLTVMTTRLPNAHSGQAVTVVSQNE